jgi:hypothetical protein
MFPLKCLRNSRRDSAISKPFSNRAGSMVLYLLQNIAQHYRIQKLKFKIVSTQVPNNTRLINVVHILIGRGSQALCG